MDFNFEIITSDYNFSQIFNSKCLHFLILINLQIFIQFLTEIIEKKYYYLYPRVKANEH